MRWIRHLFTRIFTRRKDIAMAEEEVPTLDNQVEGNIEAANKVFLTPVPAKEPEVIPELETVAFSPPSPPVFADVYEAGTEVVKAAHLRLRNAKAGVAEVSAVQTEAITQMQAAQDELMAAKSNWDSAARQQIALLTESLDRNS